MNAQPLHRFPPGEFTLGPHQAWLWNDAVQGPPGQAVHPSTACMAVLCGAGATVAEIMAHLNTPAHRVVFGELAFTFLGELRPDRPMRVDTRIDSIERKHGKRMPVFDRVTLTYELLGMPDGEPLVQVQQVWIVDRSDTPTAQEAA